jgi:hypothetical protein
LWVRGDFLITVEPPARPPDHAQGPHRNETLREYGRHWLDRFFFSLERGRAVEA